MTHRPSISRSERGSVLVIVAIFSVVIFVMAAATIDVGNLRQDRRSLTTATDAASHAAVQQIDFEALGYMDGDCDAGLLNYANNFLQANLDGATLVSCTTTRTGTGSGFVSVTAEDEVEYTFAKVVGIDGATAKAASSASIGKNLGGGVRPIGVCQITQSIDSPAILLQDVIDDAQANGGDVSGGGITVTFPIENLGPSGPPGDCGTGSGYFGKLNFTGISAFGAGGNCTSGPAPAPNTFCDHVVNGYYGPIPDPSSGQTGNAYNGSDGAFDALELNGGRFWVPIFDGITRVPGRDDFNLAYLMEVTPEDHCFSGGCRIRIGSTRFTWFRWTIHRVVPFSSGVPPATSDASSSPPRICAVDDPSVVSGATDSC